MLPFTLDALRVAITKHVMLKKLTVPPAELQYIATQVFSRYEEGGPAGAVWHSQQVDLVKDQRFAYDLCRGEWAGPAYSSSNGTLIEALADALNELEGLTTT